MTFTFFITIFTTISYSVCVHEIHSEKVVTPFQPGYYKLVTNKELEFSEKSGKVSEGRSFDLGNLSTALSTLVNSTFIFKALLIYWIHVRETH